MPWDDADKTPAGNPDFGVAIVTGVNREVSDSTGWTPPPSWIKAEYRNRDMVGVRADVLLPLLVLVRKFMKSVRSTERDMPSRFVDPEDFRMALRTQGFTPEDFNSLQSLTNTIGTDLSELLDGLGKDTPQMKRTNEFGTLRQPPKAPPTLVDASRAERISDMDWNDVCKSSPLVEQERHSRQRDELEGKTRTLDILEEVNKARVEHARDKALGNVIAEKK